MDSIVKIINDIKKDFHRLRNGAIADSLKCLYPENTKILGLIAPQLTELSKTYKPNLEVALKLWEEENCRESRLFSLYLFPVKEIDENLAYNLFKTVRSIEEADFLNFKILRHLPFAATLYYRLKEESLSEFLNDYALLMFKKNLDLD